ncbi:hypothetical protein ACLOJK_024962 [Asimina triloba]
MRDSNERAENARWKKPKGFAFGIGIGFLYLHVSSRDCRFVEAEEEGRNGFARSLIRGEVPSLSDALYGSDDASIGNIMMRASPSPSARNLAQPFPVHFLHDSFHGCPGQQIYMEDSTPRHSCLKLEAEGEEGKGKSVIFVKGTWFDSRFNLSITDGLDAWICDAASESEVSERAGQWDQPVAEYVETAERYLGFQQPGSVYRFADAGNGNRRPSISTSASVLLGPGTINIKFVQLPGSEIVCLDLLHKEEVVRKTQSFDRLKAEAGKCLAQSERFKDEKAEFESAIYAKFVEVLNSKKAKLRELRDKLSKCQASEKSPEGEDESTDRTEIYDEESDDVESNKQSSEEDLPSTSNSTATTTSKGRKRKTRK